MPEVTRVSKDQHVGHASPTPNPFHQTAYAVGSENVLTNSEKTVRIGDTTSCGDPATGGSTTVFVNGIGVHRKGDATGGHGSWIPNSSASGSDNVFAG
tara:strand:- start:350 stop:643 length:294 start_codon:yes stop_codon:yes gene_type:complete